MVVDIITRVTLDPVSEFDDVIKFQKDPSYRRRSVNTVAVVYEKTDYVLKPNIEDLLTKEQKDV